MDNFSSFPTTPISPARSATTVAPNDSTDLPHVSRAIYVGQTGDLSVVLADGDQVVFEAVPGGAVLPIRVSGVNATGTTASAILSLW